MLFIDYPKGQWREWDQERMLAFNFRGGHCKVDENNLGEVECREYDSWHALYRATGFCPLEVESWARDVWIYPQGKFYDGEAHEVAAEHLLELIYGEEIDYCCGDVLEEKGWVRATTSAMWEVRMNEWEGKTLTQRQYDSLFDWCTMHKKRFPDGLIVR